MQYRQSIRSKLMETMVREFALSQSNIFRKAFITFCTHAVKVFSVSSFKDHFLEHYIVMATDRVAEVRLKFLYSAPVIRPYLEQDIDLMLRYNEILN